MALSTQTAAKMNSSLVMMALGANGLIRAANEATEKEEIAPEAMALIRETGAAFYMLLTSMNSGVKADFELPPEMTSFKPPARVADSELPDINFVTQDLPNN